MYGSMGGAEIILIFPLPYCKGEMIMKSYIGCKLIKAVPMNLGQYNYYKKIDKILKLF